MINGLLKDELGFQGFIMSDWLAQMSGVASALAGLDMGMPGDTIIPLLGYSYWMYQMSEAILNGSIPVDRLDDAATRVVAAWYQMGQEYVFLSILIGKFGTANNPVAVKTTPSPTSLPTQPLLSDFFTRAR